MHQMHYTMYPNTSYIIYHAPCTMRKVSKSIETEMTEEIYEIVYWFIWSMVRNYQKRKKTIIVVRYSKRISKHTKQLREYVSIIRGNRWKGREEKGEKKRQFSVFCWVDEQKETKRKWTCMRRDAVCLCPCLCKQHTYMIEDDAVWYELIVNWTYIDLHMHVFFGSRKKFRCNTMRSNQRVSESEVQVWNF